MNLLSMNKKKKKNVSRCRNCRSQWDATIGKHTRTSALVRTHYLQFQLWLTHTHTAESENWCEHVTRLSWMLRILSIEFFSRLSFIDRRQQKKTKRKSSLEIKWHKASEWISMWMVCYYIKLLSNNKTFDHVKPYNSKFNVFIFVVFFADGTISQPFHHRSIVIFTFENISLYYIYTMKLLLFIVSWYVPKPFVLFTGFFVLLLYL